MRTKLLVATLLAGSSLFAQTHFSIGVGVGHGYAAPPVLAYQAPYPGPGTWVDGYWDHAGPRRLWHNGYWVRPSYSRPDAAEYRFENRFDGNRYESNGYNGNGRDGNRPSNVYDGNQSFGNGYSSNGYDGSHANGNSNVSNGNSPTGNRSNESFSNGTNGNSAGNRFNNPNARR